MVGACDTLQNVLHCTVLKAFERHGLILSVISPKVSISQLLRILGLHNKGPQGLKINGPYSKWLGSLSRENTTFYTKNYYFSLFLVLINYLILYYI